MPAGEGRGVVGPDRADEMDEDIALGLVDRGILGDDQDADPCERLVQEIGDRAEGGTLGEREEVRFDLALDIGGRITARHPAQPLEHLRARETRLGPQPERILGVGVVELPFRILAIDHQPIRIGDHRVEIDAQVAVVETARHADLGAQRGLDAVGAEEADTVGGHLLRAEAGEGEDARRTRIGHEAVVLHVGVPELVRDDR